MKIFVLGCLILFLGVHTSSAQEKKIEVEYTYQASEYDSKVEARERAVEQAKVKGLAQVGEFVSSIDILAVQEIRNGQNESMLDYFESQIMTRTAGVVKTEVLEESWNGEEFWVLVSLIIDESEVRDTLNSLANDTKERYPGQVPDWYMNPPSVLGAGVGRGFSREGEEYAVLMALHDFHTDSQSFEVAHSNSLSELISMDTLTFKTTYFHEYHSSSSDSIYLFNLSLMGKIDGYQNGLSKGYTDLVKMEAMVNGNTFRLSTIYRENGFYNTNYVGMEEVNGDTELRNFALFFDILKGNESIIDIKTALVKNDNDAVWHAMVIQKNENYETFEITD